VQRVDDRNGDGVHIALRHAAEVVD